MIVIYLIRGTKFKNFNQITKRAKVVEQRHNVTCDKPCLSNYCLMINCVELLLWSSFK